MEKIVCNNCGAENAAGFRFCAACGHELPRITAPREAAGPDLSQLVTESKRKNRIALIAGVITCVFVFVVSFFIIRYFTTTMLADREALSSVAAALNKSCPMMVDSETRLDHAAALPDNILQYNYTLINTVRGSVDTAAIREYITPILIENARTNPQMQYFRDKNTTLSYYYQDKHGAYLLQVLISPDAYK